jgi:hypothetical protein
MYVQNISSKYVAHTLLGLMGIFTKYFSWQKKNFFLLTYLPLNSKIWVGIGETNIFLEYGPISFKTAQNQ